LKAFYTKKDGSALANPSFPPVSDLFPSDAIKPQGCVTVAYMATARTIAGCCSQKWYSCGDLLPSGLL